MLDDKRLIKKCLRNERFAFEELYKRFSAKMFGLCLRYARNYHDAEDLLHDGFIRVIERLKDFRSEGSFEGWMRKVMVTTAINYYRKNIAGHYDVDIADIPQEDILVENIYSYLSTKELMDYVQKLPDGYRMVFNLYVIEGYKHHEIAEIMNISENTSKSQLMKARRCLMKSLKETEEYERVV